MEIVKARGHLNVTSRHATTIEVTRAIEIGKRADCIIGVKADKGLAQLSDEFKLAARNSQAHIRVVFEANGFQEVVHGWGHEDLTFEDEDDLVIRKSGFICPRTLMIRADKASMDLDNGLVEALKRDDAQLTVKISIQS